MRSAALVIMVALAIVSTYSRQSPQHGQLYDKYRYLLCDQSPDWTIVGVLYLAANLYLVVEVSSEQSYLVYEFAPDAILNTVIDVNLVRRIAELQQVWQVDAHIRPTLKRIESMFTLHGDGRTTGHHDAIVFVLRDHQTEVYCVESGRMSPLDNSSMANINNMPNLVPLISPLKGAILYTDSNHHWRYQDIKIKDQTVWPVSDGFMLAEGPSLYETSLFDRNKERLLILALGASESTLSEPVEPNQLFRTVDWIWAQGYLNLNDIFHVLTDQAVYVFARSDLPEMFATEDNKLDLLVTMRALRLDYADYFVCHKRNNASTWNFMFEASLYLLPVPLISHNRMTVIYLLFGAHFLVALVMVAAIVLVQWKKSNKKRLEFHNRCANFHYRNNSKSNSKTSKRKSNSPSSSSGSKSN